MRDKDESPLAPDDALERIRLAADSRSLAHAADSVPDALLEKAWNVSQSYRQWNAKHPSVGVVVSQVMSANDWAWTEYTLGGMAAETPSDRTSAIRRVPRSDSGERWSLSRYPIIGQGAAYLMFEAESDNIERYVGCKIQVLAEGRTFDLGVVNDDGAAELRLEDIVDISRALVRIGRRTQGE